MPAFRELNLGAMAPPSDGNLMTHALLQCASSPLPQLHTLVTGHRAPLSVFLAAVQDMRCLKRVQAINVVIEDADWEAQGRCMGTMAGRRLELLEVACRVGQPLPSDLAAFYRGAAASQGSDTFRVSLLRARRRGITIVSIRRKV